MEWFNCPECGEKLFWIQPNAVISGMNIRCKSCCKLINVCLHCDDSSQKNIMNRRRKEIQKDDKERNQGQDPREEEADE